MVARPIPSRSQRMVRTPRVSRIAAAGGGANACQLNARRTCTGVWQRTPNYCSAYGSYNPPTVPPFHNVYACATTASSGPTPFDSNGTQSFQCTELSARFLWAIHGILVPAGNQSGSTFVNSVSKVYPAIPVRYSAPGSVPAPGDVISLGPGGGSDPQFGHTAVVVSSAPASGSFTILSENDPEGRAGEQVLSVDLTGAHNRMVKFHNAWTTASWLSLQPSLTRFHPTAAAWPSGTRNTPGQQDVFWKGAGNNGLWEAVWNNGWHGPSPVPGVSTVASSPTAVVNGPRNEEDIFWQGTDNQLWVLNWAGGWSTPHAVGMGPLGSEPSAVWPSGTRNTPGQQDVFWKGAGNNGLWEAVWNNGWHGPSPVPGVSTVASSPTAVVNGPRNEEDIFWQGTDNQLWVLNWAGGWSTPHAVGMGPLGSEPSAAVWPSGTRNTPGQQDVFWKGAGNNGLWEAVWNNGWHGPSPVPGVSNVASSPTAVVNGPRNEEDIFYKGTDSQLWEITWAGRWYAPHVVGMGPLG